MVNQFRKGETVLAFVEGQYRELVIDDIASNGQLAQCYWTEGATRRFVMIVIGAARKLEDQAVSVRGHA